MRDAILTALTCIAAFAVGLRLYMTRPAESVLFPEERVAIGGLRPPLAANAALACPAGYCAVPEAMRSPEFAIGAQPLAACWTAMLAREPRVTPLEAAPDGMRRVVMQRSPVFGFPDLVTVEFVALDPDRSSLAIYSRARYGRIDFGVNRRRVEDWLAGLVSQIDRGGCAQ